MSTAEASLPRRAGRAEANPKQRRDRTVLILIGLFKLTKAALLFSASFGAFETMHRGVGAALAKIAERINPDAHPLLFEKMLSTLTRLDPHKLTEIGVGTAGYALLFTVEGTGLLLQRHWAEYVTIVSTAAFIPLEVVEILKRPHALRIAVLVINVAILLYLVLRVRRRSHR